MDDQNVGKEDCKTDETKGNMRDQYINVEVIKQLKMICTCGLVTTLFQLGTKPILFGGKCKHCQIGFITEVKS